MKDNPAQLVTDWGGFERLVAALHETGTVRVSHDETLTGSSGAPRQIDVVVRHREGLYDHLVIIECKLWKRKVTRTHVDALATAVRDLGASRGVIFSAAGFQPGAITAAKQEHIDLFRVRSLTDEEWGAPGRVVKLYLQTCTPSLGNFKVDEATGIGTPQTRLDIRLGGGADSTTPTHNPKTNAPGPSLEQILTASLAASMKEILTPSFTVNGGVKCTSYMASKVVINPKEPLVLPVAGGILFIKKMSYDLGVRIDQEPIEMDRGAKYDFALAVEDCVRNILSAAAKGKEDSSVHFSPLRTEADRTEDAVANGSVIQVFLKTMFPFEELGDKTPVDHPLTSNRNVELALDKLL